MPGQALCRWCEREVIWCEDISTDRRPIALDLTPVDEGGTYHVSGHLAMQVPASRREGQRLRVPHKETCPAWERASAFYQESHRSTAVRPGAGGMVPRYRQEHKSRTLFDLGGGSAPRSYRRRRAK